MQRHQPHARLIPANEYRRVRWRNGAGWTREIHAEPRDARAMSAVSAGEDWDWRLSIAEIEQDAAFSAFPGVERELVLLSGNGLHLDLDDGQSHLLQPPHGRLRFAGERDVHGRLVEGRTEDFNLMWRRDAVDATLWHRPLVGAMVVFVDPGHTWAVHQVAGDAGIGGDAMPPLSLAMGDTALLQSGGGRGRYVLEGGGEVLLARIEPRAQAAPQ